MARSRSKRQKSKSKGTDKRRDAPRAGVGTVLSEHSRSTFTFAYTDVDDWLDVSMATPDAWRQIQTENRYSLDITAIIYEVR